MKPVLSTVLACTLAVSLVSAGVIMSALGLTGSAYADSGKTAKDETVYVKASADGAVEGVFVVNRFASGAGTVVDPGEYLSVTNLTTSGLLAQEAGGVEVPLQEDRPFYYEGQLDAATTELPWDVSLVYWLNGQQVDAAQIGGASGDVRIELSVTARTEAGVSDFANAYVLQAQGTFDASTYEIESAQGAMVAQVGGESVVSCMVLPGEDASFTIEGTARSFESSGWQISALPLELAIEIANQDTSKLTDATSQLESATAQLSSGSSSLAAGAASAVSGADELAEGAATLKEGTAALRNGSQTLAEGMSELNAQSSDLLSGWGAVYSGAGELSEGAAALSGGSDTYASTLANAEEEVASAAKLYDLALSFYESALSKYAADPSESNKENLDKYLELVIAASQATGAQQALEQALEGYAALANGIEEIEAGVQEVHAGAGQLDEGLQQYVSAVGVAAEGASTLSEGAVAVAEGVETLSRGANELESGLNTLGAGSAQLASGADELAASVKGMDAQVLDALQEAIDQKLGADFEQHSFVAPDNTQVGSVQFVYVVEGVSGEQQASEEAPAADSADSADSAGPAEEKGAFDRIRELFGGIVEALKQLFS